MESRQRAVSELKPNDNCVQLPEHACINAIETEADLLFGFGVATAKILDGNVS